MSKTDYMPRTDAEKALWLKNFANKLPGYTTKYGLVVADATEAQKSADFFAWILDARNLINESTNKWTTYRDEMRDGIEAGAVQSTVPAAATLPTMPALVTPGIITRATSLANRIKKHTTYTLADGRDLGIEGTKEVTDLLPVKLSITIRFAAGHPEICMDKSQDVGHRNSCRQGQYRQLYFPRDGRLPQLYRHLSTPHCRRNRPMEIKGHLHRRTHWLLER